MQLNVTISINQYQYFAPLQNKISFSQLRSSLLGSLALREAVKPQTMPPPRHGFIQEARLERLPHRPRSFMHSFIRLSIFAFSRLSTLYSSLLPSLLYRPPSPSPHYTTLRYYTNLSRPLYLSHFSRFPSSFPWSVRAC